MTSLSNYDKARDATAAAFLRYDQAQMIRTALDHDPALGVHDPDVLHQMVLSFAQHLAARDRPARRVSGGVQKIPFFHFSSPFPKKVRYLPIVAGIPPNVQSFLSIRCTAGVDVRYIPDDQNGM